MELFSKPVQRVDTILAHCDGKNVLHLGCTNWPYTDSSMIDNSLLHASIAKRSRELYGIDSDELGLEALRGLGFTNLFRSDLEKLDNCGIDTTFDIVIAGEMIEHLSNPGAFLSGVKRFLRPDSQLLITTVNAYCAIRTFLYAFLGKGGKREPVHPDHVAYYSYSTLNLLLTRHGFQVEEFYFYDIGKEHRSHNRLLVNLTNDVAVRIFPQLSDGLIAVCTSRCDQEELQVQ
ncbi:MAG TPA: methyltransferase domain-containing protein [Pyrinomonadaceae bacterium]